jgi:hypothetical protein
MAEHHPKILGSDVPTVVLALRAPAAAKALGISPRLLATLTAEHRVPHVRLNKAVVYPVADLQRWLTDQARRCHDSTALGHGEARKDGAA